jgi:hypothetical protein
LNRWIVAFGSGLDFQIAGQAYPKISLQRSHIQRRIVRFSADCQPDQIYDRDNVPTNLVPAQALSGFELLAYRRNICVSERDYFAIATRPFDVIFVASKIRLQEYALAVRRAYGDKWIIRNGFFERFLKQLSFARVHFD